MTSFFDLKRQDGIDKKRVFFPSRKYAVRDLSEAIDEIPGYAAYNAPDLNDRSDVDLFRDTFEKYVSEYKPHIVVWEGFFAPFVPRIALNLFMQKMKEKYNFKLVYWSTEDVVHYNSLCRDRGVISDVVLTTSRSYVDKYRKELGKDCREFLFSANTNNFKPLPVEGRYISEISYVGNNYNERSEGIDLMIKPLIAGGYNFKIYGKWWLSEGTVKKRQSIITPPTWVGQVPRREVPNVFNSSQINICLQNNKVFDDETHTTFKPFEVLACGAFLIAQESRALKNIFGDKIVMVNSRDEFLSKVDYYIEHHNERKAVAEEGRNFVLANHTAKHRAIQITEMFRELNW